MSELILDLNNRHFERSRGPFTIIGTWIRIESGIEPCLCICRKGFVGKHTPCVIPVDAGWKWELDRGDPAECAFNAAEYLQLMNLEVTHEAIKQLVFFVHDNIGDLYSIPPSRQLDETQEKVAEVTLNVNGSKKEVLI